MSSKKIMTDGGLKMNEYQERNHNIRIPGFASDETRISISQSAIAPATGTGGASGKKSSQNANVTLRSQRLAQVAGAKKEAKLM